VNLKGSKTEKNLKDAFAGESQANRRYLYFAAKADVEGYNDVSAGMAKNAREEGFSEIADWFETLAKAERSHANRFQKALDTI
jgi:rubrerythrin